MNQILIIMRSMVLLAAAIGYGPAMAQPQPADLIMTSAKVITVDAAFAVKDGKVLSVGETSEIEPHRGPSTRVIDAKGRAVIPGLNDSHAHVIREGRLYNTELRWDGVDSLVRGLAMIREQAKRTPKGQWVQVIGGWSPYQFKERRLPTVQELNTATPDTAVLVLFLYSQGLLNRAGV